MSKLDREIYLKWAKRFVDAGLMREIYSGETLAICNMANQAYAVFAYLADRYGPPGLVVMKHEVESIVCDEKFFLHMLTMDENDLRFRSFRLDDKRFEILTKYKEQSEEKGPSSNVDFELEERIRQRRGLNKDAYMGRRGGTVAILTENGWRCGECGTENSRNYGQCKKCGLYRRATDDRGISTKPPVVQGDSWQCSNCGVKNSCNYGQCKKCGQYRR